MNFFRSSLSPLAALAMTASAWAAPASGTQLASQLSELHQRGSAFVRVRMEINGAAKETLQLQIKERRTKSSSEVVYQVLFPRERKGEAVLLRKSGNKAATGSLFVPPNTVRPIEDLKGALFGSDLAYEDVIENFFAWSQQTIVGTAEIHGAPCQILESKPGKGEHSTYPSVRSWIDTRRMVPLLIEKYSSSGQPVRRIETTRVVTVNGQPIPANLTIRGPRQASSTDMDGSRIKQGVTFSDADFSEDGLKDLTAPRE